MMKDRPQLVKRFSFDVKVEEQQNLFEIAEEAESLYNETLPDVLKHHPTAESSATKRSAVLGLQADEKSDKYTEEEL